jgi:oligoendopeptidase F
MTQTTVPHSTADGVSWDLADLYDGVDDPRITIDLQAALGRAAAFENAYRGKIVALQPGQASVLLNAVHELEALFEQMDRPAVYAMLHHSAKTDDPPRGALLSRTQEERTKINKHLIFFDLEWVALADEIARTLTAQPALAHYRHYLDHKRAWKPHFLSEPEEKVLDEKGITGRSAFNRLFEETTARLQFTLSVREKQESLSLQEILAKLYDADREVRRAAAVGISAGLQSNERLLTFIFNTVVLDHTVDGRLRNFAGPMDSRNLANEITPEVVEALMSATERHFSLVQRYYRLKGKLLGLDKLFDYDRYAPIAGDLPACAWSTAQRIVQESYDALSPDAGAVIRQFFDKRWVDAALRPGKRGGAFSSSAVPSVHPYILMNYTDRLRDVMTLAHELGHGLHQYLSRGQGYLQCDTPLTTAEMASVFGEMLTFRRLQEIYPEPRLRLAMLCGKIEDAFATVFRQVVLTRFEQSLHRARKEQGELSAPAINELWLQANRAMFGDALEMTDGYAGWWSYIGHFIRAPFYCYAYSFGELLVLALFQKYRQDGAAFVPRYLQLLSSGGADAPHVLLAKLGVDVTDPSFWELGLRLLTEMVADAERLAASL